MLAGDTHPGGTTTAALEECSRVKISRLPVQLRNNRKPQEGQSGRAATKSRLASGEGVPLLTIFAHQRKSLFVVPSFAYEPIARAASRPAMRPNTVTLGSPCKANP